MVVLQKYYEFVDRPTSEVAKGWKIIQIVVYIIAAVSGYAIHFVIDDLKQKFNGNCILYPNISFVSGNASEIWINQRFIDEDGNNPLVLSGELDRFFQQENGTITVIDESKTTWGNEALCDFCEYVPIMGMIIGTILITLFIMCPRGGSTLSHVSGIKRPVNIVLPSLFITGIFASIMLASALKSRNGLIAFCAEFGKVLNSTKCSQEIQQFTYKDGIFLSNALTDIHLIFLLSGSCTAAWIIGLTVLIFRTCCAVADFKLMEVTISTVHDARNLEETEVLLEQNPSTSPVSHV